MDKEDYGIIWDQFILPKYLELDGLYGDIAFNAECSNNEILQYYLEAREYAKNHYMSHHGEKAEQLINRYKIAAAFIIAILKAKPLKKADLRYYKDSPDKWIFNESLALYTSLMIVRCFLLEDLEKKNPSSEYCEIVKAAFGNALPLDTKARNRWEIELYFLRQEGCYNLLSLAHEIEDFVKIALYHQANKSFSNEQLNSIYKEIDAMLVI